MNKMIQVTFQAQAPGWRGWFGEAQCWEALRAWRGGRGGRWGRRGWSQGAGSSSSAPGNQQHYLGNIRNRNKKYVNTICTKYTNRKYTKIYFSGLVTWERKELWGRGVCKLETKFETVTGMLWPVSCNTNTIMQHIQIQMCNTNTNMEHRQIQLCNIYKYNYATHTNTNNNANTKM